MRRILIILVVVGAAALGMLFAQTGAQKPQTDTKIIDLMADVVYPITIVGDSTATALVGNFAAQHNGAVITCDSAVRYSDKRIQFFGNVLINKNTTYIYGDRADYNGDLNEAQVFSDLIKVVDGDATLYTYKFSFNTKTNIGVFDSGGIMINRDNLMESVRGYYYADAKELVCVEQVEMRNDEYEMKSDSVIYNMATDHAYFFDRTNIWSKDGDYLYANCGQYNKTDSLYSVTRSGYVLTEKQEIWSDSLDYYRTQEHIILYRDIQIDDTEHKVLAFGDYGEYWKHPGNAFLTRRPSVISYDAEQGDSLFMRADSMFLFTRNTAWDRAEAAARVADSLAHVTDSLARKNAQDSLRRDQPSRPDSLGSSRDNASPKEDVPGAKQDSTATSSQTPSGVVDSLGSQAKTTGADSLSRTTPPEGLDSLAQAAAADTVRLTPAEQKAKLKAEVEKAKTEKKKIEAEARRVQLDSIGAQRQAKVTAKLMAQKEREEARLQAQRLKIESKLKAKQARAARKGKVITVDSTALQRIDSLLESNHQQQDSLATDQADTLAADSTQLAPRDSLDSLGGLDSLDSLSADSIYRLIKGFHHVKMYRADFQSVCDSMTAISTDSTIHLYINPVLWNEDNQITSDVMDIYTLNQQITKADFVGSPMMISQLDTMRYNQVAGKEMTAYFRNNEIYRNDVNGNAQTIYYMQDGDTEDIVMMGVVDAGNITFYIENKQVEGITYRINPTYTFYPIEKIPADLPTRLKDFKWEGARRPTQGEVFDRQIRTSERPWRSQLPHPAFPIVQRIEDHKKRLLELRRWVDRDDLVAPQADEWMRSLGFPTGQPRPKQ